MAVHHPFWRALELVLDGAALAMTSGNVHRRDPPRPDRSMQSKGGSASCASGDFFRACPAQTRTPAGGFAPMPEAVDSKKASPVKKPGQIRVGIGGWTFEAWRGEFYPKGLSHAKELAYASSKLTSIEINGTFYRTQTPATFAKWRKEVPDGFVFSVKGPQIGRAHV